jgi:2-polyprenyl-3-methyl-5-hydroxy-6-metoxy-1,4-benzoquinol methylase
MTSRPVPDNGGYEAGYRSCSCFWGREPGRLVRQLAQYRPSLQGAIVLDAGCGEGKNAAFLAQAGATVRAIDVSSHAIANGRKAWPDLEIGWEQADITQMDLRPASFDVVVCYGLLHCLSSAEAVASTIARFKMGTTSKGHHVICTFNSRLQELEQAHPGFNPVLLPHSFFLELYADWEVLEQSDEDLLEEHPHNKVLHRHSMSRLIVRAP